MLNKIRADLSREIPTDIVDALLSSYEEIKRNYYLGRYEPSELNGGKFTEACYRILECETQGGCHTPIGISVNNIVGKLRDFERTPVAKAVESFRTTIPRTLIAVYNVRNKRGVCHLGGDVNPNFADSTLLVSCCDWVMAELIRIHYHCTLHEAQGMVDALVQRPLSLVYELLGTTRVLLPSLSYKNQVLILLAQVHPKSLRDTDLFRSVEHSNASVFRSSVLSSLHHDRLIEYNSDKRECAILPTGLKFVEDSYADWSNKLEGNSNGFRR